MRSYWAHLQTLHAPKSDEVLPKPIFRSSAIFPVFQQPGISSRILFMGYWMLKRNIHEIAAVVTLRSEKGKELFRSTQQIACAKSYRIELSDMLHHIHPFQKTFVGSMEIEFFTSVNMVFPFPAVIINYYGPQFSTCVHTAQRIYNDFEDLHKNSETPVPEAGFNIYADEDHDPFIAIINGIEPIKNTRVKIQFFNIHGDTLTHEMHLDRVEPYETRIIHASKEVSLASFLQGKVGTAKISFHMNWIFPRLIVGNRQPSKKAMVITHTYYDCTAAKKNSDYWRPKEKPWHPASLMIPVTVKEHCFTNLYFYPIYSPSTLSIDIEIFDHHGTSLERAINLLTLESPGKQFKRICLKELCQQMGIATQNPLAARVIASPLESERIPARIKIALDVGSHPHMLPCNICTNLQPFNPEMESKPKTFRWLPILADYPGASAWIMNSSPAKDFLHHAEIELTFFREQDDVTIKRKLTLPPHGFHVICPDQDNELAQFFKGKVGWVTAVSTNPYTTTYYFLMHPSGIVGGDHGF